MELHGYFRYGSGNSRNYGLILAHVDTNHDSRTTGEIETASIFSKREKRSLFTRDDYSDSPISFDVEFLVDGDEPLNLASQRSVQKWLFYQQGYWPLYIDPFCDEEGENVELVDEQQRETYINCRFTRPEKVFGNGGVIGYKATLEADSPFAWQDPIETTISQFLIDTNNNKLFVLQIDTDIKDYTYPKVTIAMGNSGGDLTIANMSDIPSRLTTFTDVPANAEIIMDAGIGMVSGQNYSRFSNKNFIRLLDGRNDFSVIGDLASIKFEWKNRRYL